MFCTKRRSGRAVRYRKIQPRNANSHYYKVIQLLGVGKSATAYLALRTGVKDKGTFHVVKLMQHPESTVKLDNFNREKKVIRKFDHSSVIFITDDGEYEAAGNKYPFYICDFYSSTLASLIKQSSLKLTRKISYAIQLCSALSHLASRSIVHCDVKPDNIYVDGLKCVLADFGLSIGIDGEQKTLDLPSLHRYRSPDIVESIKSGTSPTSKSDVFQLGLVLAELFTGKNPCAIADSGSAEVTIENLPKVHGRFGKNIDTILVSMLEIDPNNRPTSDELIEKWQTVLFKAYEYMLKVDKDVY